MEERDAAMEIENVSNHRAFISPHVTDYIGGKSAHMF